MVISKEYRMYMGSALWSKKRNARIRIDGSRCVICGSDHDLNVHHLTYRNFMHENVQQDLVTLCITCHMMLHRIKEQSKDQYQEYKEADKRYQGHRKDLLIRILHRLIIVEIWQRDISAGGDVRIFDSGKKMIGNLTRILQLIYPDLRYDLSILGDEVKDDLGVFRSALVVQSYRAGASQSQVARQYNMKVINVQKILKRHGFNQSARFNG